MTIILDTDIPPSKKNSRNIFMRGGRPVNIPSKNYANWHEIAIWKLPRIAKPIDHAICVYITFLRKSKVKFDNTNKAESIMDLLVDGGILRNDSWDVVPKVIIETKESKDGIARVVIDIRIDENTKRTVEASWLPPLDDRY